MCLSYRVAAEFIFEKTPLPIGNIKLNLRWLLAGQARSNGVESLIQNHGVKNI